MVYDSIGNCSEEDKFAACKSNVDGQDHNSKS